MKAKRNCTLCEAKGWYRFKEHDGPCGDQSKSKEKKKEVRRQ